MIQTYVGAGQGCNQLRTLRRPWRGCDRWQRGGRSSDGLPETGQAIDLLRSGHVVPTLYVLLEQPRVEMALLRGRALVPHGTASTRLLLFLPGFS